MDTDNLKKQGFRRSNFKGYLETDPDSFDEKLAEKEKTLKSLGLKERECGDCNLCCKLVPVPALKKDGNEWCTHCEIGVGCKIYKNRPLDCQAFSCLWSISITPEEYKPNKVGFYMTLDSMNDANAGMLKVYTERHRLDSTIKKLKNYKNVRNNKPKGFHISFGNRKEDSCFLHVDFGKNGEYGLKNWDGVKKEAEKELAAIPEKFREEFINAAKETW